MRLGRRRCDGFSRELDDRGRDRGRRQDEVHLAGFDRVPRHPVVGGLRRVLRHDQAALRLHGLQSRAAVRPRSRQDHADRLRSAFLRKRVQQGVKGLAGAVGLARGRKVQHAGGHRQGGVGRDNVEVLALEPHSLLSLPDNEPRVAGEQIHHHAFMSGIEMLNEDEGHPARSRDGLHELLARLQATCRRADPDDREIELGAWSEFFGHRFPSPSLRVRGLWTSRRLCHFAVSRLPCVSSLPAKLA